MTVRLHRGDLPDLTRYTTAVAIDTETMGLNPHRDRLCVVQLSNGDGSADVVQIPKDHADAPNLKALLANPKITKIFHFARFDLAALTNASLRYAESAHVAALTILAGGLLVFLTLLIVVLFLRTLRIILNGSLLTPH